MAFYKHQYMHQTVEHCLKRPTPSNVGVAHTDADRTVYTVDLPASVWTAVVVPTGDEMDAERHSFPSESLRREWIHNYIDSLRGRPLASAARPGR